MLSNLIWTTGEIPNSFTRSLICPIFKQGKKPSEECSSYRPIALTSCLSKLIERLVVTLLTYHLEHDGILSHLQSAYQRGWSTLNPLMRLISDVHLGFETKPFLRIIVTTLDLSSAFNRVDHLKLLDLFQELHIPPIYARFYKAFLLDCIFWVQYGNTKSRWAKESCGTPQGTVSSPFLFINYMEGMLRTILPTATNLGIQITM
jgi:hypothetical protein